MIDPPSAEWAGQLSNASAQAFNGFFMIEQRQMVQCDPYASA